MSLYGRVLAVRVANNELNLVYSTIRLALSKKSASAVSTNSLALHPTKTRTQMAASMTSATPNDNPAGEPV
jgi:hypothetical protein